MAPMSDEPWREGGEPACMLHLVCPECGRIRKRPGDPVCEHCGAAAEDEDPATGTGRGPEGVGTARAPESGDAG